MLRKRMKEMDLKVTELSDYLQISRPTMYKFIECYESKDFEAINKRVLKLFNFIAENELVGKKTVVAYILNNLVELKPLGEKTEVGVINSLRKYIVSNPESKKSKFLEMCATSDRFDGIVCYLADVNDLKKKKRLSDEEKAFLEPYENLIEKIKAVYKGE